MIKKFQEFFHCHTSNQGIVISYREKVSKEVELRKCTSFDTRDRIMQEKKENYDERFKDIEQDYNRKFQEMQKKMKQMQDMMKELLRSKDLPQDERQFRERAPHSAESSSEPGNDNTGFVSDSERSKQTNKSSGNNGNNHMVNSSLGET